jgi:hypothetical protein
MIDLSKAYRCTKRRKIYMAEIKSNNLTGNKNKSIRFVLVACLPILQQFFTPPLQEIPGNLLHGAYFQRARAPVFFTRIVEGKGKGHPRTGNEGPEGE